MKKNINQIKLTTMIALIIIAIIIIMGIIAIILNKNSEDKNSSKAEGNNTIQTGGEKSDAGLNYADADFSFKFLKMENNKENMIYSPVSIKYALQIKLLQ